MFDTTQRQIQSKEVCSSHYIFLSRFQSYFLPLDIPDLSLNAGFSLSPLEDEPASPTMTLSSTGADASAPSSRRTSFSSSGRPGTSMSHRSGSSSRSTSFNLPRRASRSRSPGGEVDFEEDDMDEDGEFVLMSYCLTEDLITIQPLRSTQNSFGLVEGIIPTRRKL